MYNKNSLALRERSLFMAEVGTEEKVLCFLKNILPRHLLKSNFLYPNTKENSRTRVYLCLNMVYVFTLPPWSEIILLPNRAQRNFSSDPTPVINTDHSLNNRTRTEQINVSELQSKN